MLIHSAFPVIGSVLLRGIRNLEDRLPFPFPYSVHPTSHACPVDPFVHVPAKDHPPARSKTDSIDEIHAEEVQDHAAEDEVREGPIAHIQHTSPRGNVGSLEGKGGRGRTAHAKSP